MERRTVQNRWRASAGSKRVGPMADRISPPHPIPCSVQVGGSLRGRAWLRGDDARTPLELWVDGKTGFPFVDCFMRELQATGGGKDLRSTDDLTTHHSPLTSHHSLLPTIHHSPFTTHHSPLTHYTPPTIYYPLLTTPLTTAHSSPHSLPPHHIAHHSLIHNVPACGI